LEKTEGAMPTVGCFLFTGTYSLTTRRGEIEQTEQELNSDNQEKMKKKREREIQEEERTLIGPAGERRARAMLSSFFFFSFLSLFLPLLIFERFPRPYNEPLDRTRRGRFSLQG
jgi:hypothetical protein